MAGNLAKTVKNLKIEEPKFEKWNEFLPEIKLECIKKLDFKTRWNLRSTSHTERALVDTQKMNFEFIRVNLFRLNLQFFSSGRTVKINTHYKPETMIIILEYLLKLGIIDTLHVSDGISKYGKMNALQKISVKRLELNNVADLGICFWLGCLNEKIERIEIDSACRFEKLLNIPSVSHSHFIQIVHLTTFGCAPQLAQMWIDKDVEIGRTFQAMVWKESGFAEFSESFPNKIVSETPNHVRIRTENPAKHILLELGKSYQEDKSLRMSVIPADLKELDTDKSWVRVLEKTLPVDDSHKSWSLDETNGENLYGRRDYLRPRPDRRREEELDPDYDSDYPQLDLL